jgi:SAM-dependent methyltransferase
MATTADIATLNRVTWEKPEAIAQFCGFHGFIDAGERAAFSAIAPRVRGAAAIDIGVGGGRTVSLVRLLTDDYVAIDYSAGMVETCRQVHPGVDVRVGDARDLEDFDDGRFGFALFSFNGIDAVDHEDRPKVLQQMFRVLRPGAWMLYSTHNQHGPSFHDVPWRGYARRGSAIYRAIRWMVRLPFGIGRYRKRWLNWWQLRSRNRGGEGWGERPSAPHNFGIVLHYVTLDFLLAEVAAAGFTNIEVYDSETGRRLARGDDTRHAQAFYVVAQRPAS